MSSKKILITGSSGLLGFNLSYKLHQKKHETIIGQYFLSPNRPQFIETTMLDLTDLEATKKAIQRYRPDVIINCAAMTNVDRCEEDPKTCFSANSNTCENLVTALQGKSCKLIHISTDQLWDGTKSFLTEMAPPDPINIYGQAKLEGENHIKKHKNHLILRTNFFGGDLPWRSSFTGWLKDNFENNVSFDAFNDIYFTPIALPILLNIIIDAIAHDLSGMFHLGGKERLSKYEFALQYAHLMNYNANLITKNSSDIYKTRAKRPKDMSLDSTKIEAALGIELPAIKESLLSIASYEASLNTLEIF
ncbi:MAG: SDR family oxidoreductase [Alphaproteobacteria bacterium]|nr:SDR family oxidoreductase [Candidatus Parcubacteria bacterium]NCQ67540.1 SDR family oxidoreductase [Alphaproteobacteria bacterium]